MLKHGFSSKIASFMPMSNKKRSEAFSVLLVGCGQIAGGYDQPGGNAIKTHAKAYLHHGGFRLAGCVDPDVEKARDFARRWQVDEAFPDLEAAAGAAYDVVSICSPLVAHAGQLQALLDWDVRLVFCEKPLTIDTALSQEIVDTYRARNRPLAVNYQRRWDPSVRKVKADIASGRWGRLLSAHGIYTKGIYANGSHLIDLLHTLIGPLEPIMVTEQRIDYLPDDPTLGGILRTEDHRLVVLSIGDSRCFTIFELDLLFEQGRITFGDSGWTLCERRVTPDPRYERYFILEPQIIRPSTMDRAMSAAVANLYEFLAGERELVSTGETALVSQLTCQRLHALASTTQSLHVNQE